MRTTNPLSSPQRGFSLIEALVAAALFAFILLGTVPLFIRSLQDTARNRNQLHFNNGAQAVMDELTARLWVDPGWAAGNAEPGDQTVVSGWHVYANAVAQTLNANTPASVTELLRGAGAANTAATTQSVQNNLLAQVQYSISTEFGRRRVDVQVLYFNSSNYAVSIGALCATGPASVNDPVYHACTVLPAHVSIASMSSYIDIPVQR